jgi:hypothetical protein
MMNGLFLETWRCPDGFEFGLKEERRRQPDDFEFEERPRLLAWVSRDRHTMSQQCFYPRTERREPLRLEIENLENPVVVEFVNAREDADRTAFFTKYGPPSDEAVMIRRHVLEAQQRFRNMLTHVSEHHQETLLALNEKNRLPKLIPKFDLAGEGGAIRMLLECPTLSALMSMEVATAAMNGVKMGTCEHCGDVFLTGPLTGRRSHAKFCSARCRVAAMRARNQAIPSASATIFPPPTDS